jgi:hypothetical protein
VAEQFQQVAVQVDVAGGDQVDDGDGDTLLQEGGPLGQERPPVIRPVLAPWADELHGCDQVAPVSVVVDAHLVFGLFGRAGSLRDRRLPEPDPRFSGVPVGQRARQRQDEHGWPAAIPPLPRGLVVERRMEVVAQRHEGTLRP